MKKRVLPLALAAVAVGSLLPMNTLAVKKYTTEEITFFREYEEMNYKGYSEEGLMIVKRNGKYGLVDTDGKEVIPCNFEYDFYIEIASGMVVDTHGDSAYDLRGNVIVPAGKYPYLWGVSDDLVLVTSDDYQYGYVDVTGKEVISCQYADAEKFSEGLAAVRKSWTDEWGYIDKTGKMVISAKYDEAEQFTNGFARVKKNEKWGFVNREGTEVVSCKYDTVSDFEDGVAKVQLNGKTGYVNTSGAEIIPCGKYDSVDEFAGGCVAVMSGGKYGLVNAEGSEVVACKYDGIGDTSEELVKVMENGKIGFINKNGQAVVPCGTYDEVKECVGGLAQVKKDGKWGCIDATGAVVIPLRYDSVGAVTDGVVKVELDGECGYVNTLGQEIVPCGKYRKLGDFSDGLATANGDGFFGYIDTTGAEVLSCKGYVSISDFEHGFAEVTTSSSTTIINGVYRSNRTVGLIDTEGNVVIPCEYNSITRHEGNYEAQVFRATKNDKTVYVKYSCVEIENANPTTNTLLVDGAEKLPAAYLINDNNYFKLRDVAALLNGTPAQFSIGWDGETGAITIQTGEAYTANGSELQGKPADVTTAQLSQSTVYINGEKVDLTAYLINDNNYFKLRDLGKALGFNVSWDSVKGAVLLESDKLYSDAN